MAKFWVTYEATLIIEAENEEEAKDIFHQCYCFDDTRIDATVNGIEEIPEEDNGYWNAVNADEGWC